MSRLDQFATGLPHTFWEWFLIALVVFFLIWGGRKMYFDWKEEQEEKKAKNAQS